MTHNDQCPAPFTMKSLLPPYRANSSMNLLRAAETRKPRKTVVLQGLSAALQDGLEPTTP